MALSTVASYNLMVSSVESEAYESFFHHAFTIEDLEAEILLSPRYQEQDEGICDVHDRNLANSSYVGLIDAEEDCYLADTTIEESQRVVEVPALPKLNSTCNELSVRPSGSLLGICLPSFPEEYTTTSMSELNHRTDTRDCFQQPVPWLSDSSTEKFYTDGLVPDLAALSYNANYSLDSYTTTDTNQAGNMNSCPPFEYHMPPVWPEINHSEIQENAHSMDFVLDETLGIPPEAELLVVDSNGGFRHPDSSLILRQDPILTAKSQCYDVGCRGHIFAGNDQYLPVEPRSRPYHQFGGTFLTDATAAVSYVGPNSFECPIANAGNQLNNSNNCLILQPSTSYNLPARLSLCSSLTLL
ncbi:hypothetical protein MMC27_006279 [Xylographa pallens]|nr:hypothetical protein [Xylographa pallens]